MSRRKRWDCFDHFFWTKFCPKCGHFSWRGGTPYTPPNIPPLPNWPPNATTIFFFLFSTFLCLFNLGTKTIPIPCSIKKIMELNQCTLAKLPFPNNTSSLSSLPSLTSLSIFDLLLLLSNFPSRTARLFCRREEFSGEIKHGWWWWRWTW